MVFEDWLDQTGLTSTILERVSSIDEFTQAQRRGHLWVALAPEGLPIGFALVKEVGRVAHLDELQVLPEHGRRGVGSRLLRTVCESSIRAGYPAVTLSTFTDIPWNAPFYERRGFRVILRDRLLPPHAELVEAERARGLRTDLRVMMVYPATAAGSCTG